ncbi:MAG: protein kinase, partial [Kofleriaceae bacterium]|nr:protein kinase [Kofleriaceae bacterium]
MGRRSFAGYLCEEKLSEGLFGQTFRAINKSGVEVRVVVLDTKLSKNKEFATGLAQFSTGLAALSHPNLVTTKTVGRGKDGNLIVICSPVKNSSELTAVMSSKEIPQAIALGICMSVLRGLAYAHQKGVIHGGVHPQSVVLDALGVSRLGDLGLARALTVAAVSPDNSDLLAGLRGYLAPELTLGGAPTTESDVYSVSILFCHLLWQATAPPESSQSGLAAALRRAQNSDPTERIKTASILVQELELVLEVSGTEIASDEGVAAFLSGKESGGKESAASLSLDDVLSDGAEGCAAPAEQVSQDELPTAEFESVSDSVLDSLASDAALDSLASDVALDSLASDAALDSLASDSVLDALMSEAESEAETLEGLEATRADDPIGSDPEMQLDSAARSSEIERKAAELSKALDIAEDQAQAEAQAQMASAEEPIADDYVDDDATPLPAPRPFHADGSDHDALVDNLGRHAADHSPFDDVDDLPDGESRFKNLRLVALIVFAVAILFAVAYTISDRIKAAENEKNSQEEKLAAEAALQQPRAGNVAIESETADAAVWLLVGRTPTETFPLSSSMIHGLRFDREGYESTFGSISNIHWSGKDKERKADFSISLKPMSAEGPILLPAFPPALDNAGIVSKSGQGPVRITSQPEGAEVWLLVGTTPMAELQGIAAGQTYEFKIQKDGFRPGIAIVKEDDWYLSGREGPIRP